MSAPFHDRRDAGRHLTEALHAYAGRRDALVIGLPRGGVPVAAEIAHGLGAPLNVLAVRKISAPDYPELAIGAIAEGGTPLLDRRIIADLMIAEAGVEQATALAESELGQAIERYRSILPFPTLNARIVLLIDDGVATGATIRAAAASIREHQPIATIIAVPVGAAITCEALREVVEDVICLWAPQNFQSVSQGYEDFEPTGDSEVERLLSHACESVE